MVVSSALNQSGGLLYHLRGARFARTRWEPFRAAVARWLSKWNPDARELVIFGPSAGWCLEPLWLRSFERVTCVDPDPLARALFKARVRHPACDWIRDDFFTTYDHEALEKFLGARPNAAVLFSNVLGQLTLLGDDDEQARFLSHWRAKLPLLLSGGRPWASFHDRFSGELAPEFEQGLETRERLSDAAVLKQCYPADRRGELQDHLMEGFFPAERGHAYFSWELIPGRWHLIEGTRSGE